MSIERLSKPFFWQRYSKKVQLRIDTPYCIGVFTKEEAEERGFHFAFGSAGSVDEGNILQLFWLVDTDDGVVVDARFQAFGNSILIALGEIACELAVGKNYDQLSRMSADIIDKYARDKNDIQGVPEEALGLLNLTVDVMEEAARACTGISLAPSYVAPPVSYNGIEAIPGGYPGWEGLSLQQKLTVIEQVIAEDVRPYIELDAGGIEVLNLINDQEVIIAYKGSCTSCPSSRGATLSYIQEVIKAKIHEDLIVVPYM